MNEYIAENARTEAVEDAHDAIMMVLADYPVGIWGAALGAVIASMFEAKQDAQEIAEEERARRELE